MNGERTQRTEEQPTYQSQNVPKTHTHTECGAKEFTWTWGPGPSEGGLGQDLTSSPS